ncbi:sensor histidine kinase [Enterococcus sp. MMGLQ5-2]|nr:sensor histidine kinase [Enterococcus sp. MMGLQ5-2]NPD37993.1 sensor histidine kinase [Enterococcus sp. MMGLQ5-2]
MSYYKKVKLIFITVFFVNALFITILGIFIVQMLSVRTYQLTNEKLTMLTSDISSQFDELQTLTTEINQNKEMQTYLALADSSDLTDIERYKINVQLQKSLNWLLVSKNNIKNVIVYNNNFDVLIGKNADKNSAFQNFSAQDTIRELAMDDNIGHWYFDQNMKEVVYVRNLYNTQTSTSRRVGMMVVYLNLTFIQETLDSSGIFSNKDYLVLHYENQLSSTNLKLADKKTVLGITGYFVQARSIQIGHNIFTINYYLLNQRLMLQVIQIAIVYFVVTLLLLFVGFRIVNIFILKIVTPINTLAKTMQGFTAENDLATLTDQLDLQRNDEIGVLNTSFNNLVNEIQELILYQYQAKILHKEMEFKFLQAQLNPHFLYNTLNSINWMAINENNMEIVEMVTALTFLLRSKFEQQKESHSIKEELDIIDAYILIQSIRFKNRLTYQQNIADEVLTLQIPALIIQPLIENAVKYAVEKLDSPVQIDLKIKKIDDFLLITVIDNGPGFEASQNDGHQSSGIGIKNIRSRLKIIYDKQASLSIHSEPLIETKVEIIIPLD